MQNTENHSDPKLNLEGFSEADLKRNAFKTPEGYFENLTPRIMESVRASEQVSAKPTFNWNRILIPSFGIAAIALATWFFLPPTGNPEPNFEMVLASLSVEELAEYADLQPAELVSYELVSYNEITIEESVFSDEEIIEYLSTEDEIELNTLIDEIEI
ncbi:MAG: hypothetical protein KBF73_08860 [Flavobacteriales bacterium]|nr:hypothetical protein [Flavobacteriales bacterium]